MGEIEHLPVGAVAQEDHGTSNQQLFELKAISGNLDIWAQQTMVYGYLGYIDFPLII